MTLPSTVQMVHYINSSPVFIHNRRNRSRRPALTSAAQRVVLQPPTGRDALNSTQATPQIQRPLAVAAGFHRAMAAATGNQVTGGSPRPRPRPPEISTCCGLNRPRRRGWAAERINCGRSLHGRPSPCQLSRLSRPRAVVCSRGLPPARVAHVPCDAANTGRAVRDRSLQWPKDG